METLKIKMKQNLKILNIKKEELKTAKKAIGREKVWNDTERYKLNMEMLTWIVNTDSLLLKLSKQHHEEKYNLKYFGTTDGNKNQGILLGLYYAFNCFKHNFSILSMETIKEKESNLFINSEETKYVIASNEFPEPTEAFNQKFKEYNFYVDYLVGESVELTFNSAIRYLNMQYNNL